MRSLAGENCWGESRSLSTRGAELGRDIRGDGPSQGAALVCAGRGRAAAPRSKTRIGFFHSEGRAKRAAGHASLEGAARLRWTRYGPHPSSGTHALLRGILPVNSVRLEPHRSAADTTAQGPRRQPRALLPEIGQRCDVLPRRLSSSLLRSSARRRRTDRKRTVPAAYARLP